MPRLFPSHKRIIGDDLLEQYCDVPFDFLAEHKNDEENVKPEDTGEPLKKKFKKAKAGALLI